MYKENIEKAFTSKENSHYIIKTIKNVLEDSGIVVEVDSEFLETFSFIANKEYNDNVYSLIQEEKELLGVIDKLNYIVIKSVVEFFKSQEKSPELVIRDKEEPSFFVSQYCIKEDNSDYGIIFREPKETLSLKIKEIFVDNVDFNLNERNNTLVYTCSNNVFSKKFKVSSFSSTQDFLTYLEKELEEHPLKVSLEDGSFISLRTEEDKKVCIIYNKSKNFLEFLGFSPRKEIEFLEGKESITADKRFVLRDNQKLLDIKIVFFKEVLENKEEENEIVLSRFYTLFKGENTIREDSYLVNNLKNVKHIKVLLENNKYISDYYFIIEVS